MDRLSPILSVQEDWGAGCAPDTAASVPGNRSRRGGLAAAAGSIDEDEDAEEGGLWLLENGIIVF